jgi:hypothetical protein
MHFESLTYVPEEMSNAVTQVKEKRETKAHQQQATNN